MLRVLVLISKHSVENKIEVTIFICPAWLPNVQMDSTFMIVIIKMIDTQKYPFWKCKKKYLLWNEGLKIVFVL